MWSCTCCTASAPGRLAGLLLGLLLSVRGLCAPKLGFKTTGTRVLLLPSGPGCCCGTIGTRVLLLLAGSGSRCARFPPSGLSLFADSVSLSGVPLAGSALPQSTSSCKSSLSAACVDPPAAHFCCRAHIPPIGWPCVCFSLGRFSFAPWCCSAPRCSFHTLLFGLCPRR